MIATKIAHVTQVYRETLDLVEFHLERAANPIKDTAISSKIGTIRNHIFYPSP